MDITTSSKISPVPDTVIKILNNDHIFAILAIIAFSYGQSARPKLPKWMMDIFFHDIARVLFLSLLLIVRFECRPTVAIIVAFALVYIIQYMYMYLEPAIIPLSVLQVQAQAIQNELKIAKKNIGTVVGEVVDSDVQAVSTGVQEIITKSKNDINAVVGCRL